MNSIEITIANHKYVLRGEESEAHLNEVAEMVRRKVENLRKKCPELSLQKLTMLAAFDLASQVIKGKQKAVDYRAQVLSKAGELLQKVESELSTSSNAS